MAEIPIPSQQANRILDEVQKSEHRKDEEIRRLASEWYGVVRHHLLPPSGSDMLAVKQSIVGPFRLKDAPLITGKDENWPAGHEAMLSFSARHQELGGGEYELLVAIPERDYRAGSESRRIIQVASNKRPKSRVGFRFVQYEGFGDERKIKHSTPISADEFVQKMQEANVVHQRSVQEQTARVGSSADVKAAAGLLNT